MKSRYLIIAVFVYVTFNVQAQDNNATIGLETIPLENITESPDGTTIENSDVLAVSPEDNLRKPNSSSDGLNGEIPNATDETMESGEIEALITGDLSERRSGNILGGSSGRLFQSLTKGLLSRVLRLQLFNFILSGGRLSSLSRGGLLDGILKGGLGRGLLGGLLKGLLGNGQLTGGLGEGLLGGLLKGLLGNGLGGRVKGGLVNGDSTGPVLKDLSGVSTGPLEGIGDLGGDLGNLGGLKDPLGGSRIPGGLGDLGGLVNPRSLGLLKGLLGGLVGRKLSPDVSDANAFITGDFDKLLRFSNFLSGDQIRDILYLELLDIILADIVGGSGLSDGLGSDQTGGMLDSTDGMFGGGIAEDGMTDSLIGGLLSDKSSGLVNDQTILLDLTNEGVTSRQLSPDEDELFNIVLGSFRRTFRNSYRTLQFRRGFDLTHGISAGWSNFQKSGKVIIAKDQQGRTVFGVDILFPKIEIQYRIRLLRGILGSVLMQLMKPISPMANPVLQATFRNVRIFIIIRPVTKKVDLLDFTVKRITAEPDVSIRFTREVEIPKWIEDLIMPLTRTALETTAYRSILKAVRTALQNTRLTPEL